MGEGGWWDGGVGPVRHVERMSPEVKAVEKGWLGVAMRKAKAGEDSIRFGAADEVDDDLRLVRLPPQELRD
jgi:hypothetical protein